MANRQTSDEISSLAAKILAEQPRDGDEHLSFNALLTSAKRLAGSALAQDETKGKRSKPSAGTSAYEMLAAAEQRNVEVTETLIHMVAATVLMKLAKWPGIPEGVNLEVSFSPTDMDEMHQLYDLSATRDGLITTVRIAERKALPLPPGEAHLEDRPESLMRQDEPETPFAEQVEAHSYDRPIWAIRYYKGGEAHLHEMTNKRVAEQQLPSYIPEPGDAPAQIENRFCLHPDCPAERCNHVG